MSIDNCPTTASLALLSVAWLALVAGCGGQEYPLAPVAGSVTLDGKPLANIHVTFLPQAKGKSRNAGPASCGVTDAEGRFILKTIPSVTVHTPCK